MAKPVIAASREQYSEEALGAASDKDWHQICGELNVSGLAAQLAGHCALDAYDNDQMVLTLEEEGAGLLSEATESGLLNALQAWAGRSIRLTINVSKLNVETPSMRYHRVQEETQQRLEQMISQDPFVQQLQSQLGGEIVPGSIKSKKERKDS